jgi:RNA polymerase sigma-70 factor (ECF subfamily)
VEELMRRYQKKVYRIAFHMASGDREEAKDLTQEVFFRVFQNIQKFDGRSSFYTWLYRIAVNTCLGQKRKSRRWARIIFPGSSRKGREAGRGNELEDRLAPGGGSNPAAAYRGRRLQEDVRKMLRSLPRKQRLVFQLKVMDDMSIPEIAVVTGMAEGTVKSHLYRATRKARDRLQEWRKE